MPSRSPISSSVVAPDAAPPPALRRAMLAWYDRKRRSLPWRERPSPYATVVSEFMLQQTQVATVVPYFKRFMRRFPSFAALARAPEQEVLAEWSGLGYYSRARRLKQVADRLTSKHRGRLPRDRDALRQLPGFGDYTVAAVGSIALGLPLAAVDGNVRRVIARFYAIEGNPSAKSIAALAGRLLSTSRPGDWNQAMMELGATLCTPRDPSCRLCPLRSRCRAAALGRPEAYPPPRPGPSRVEVDEIAIALFRRGRLLLLQRGERASFAGMWELPRLDSREVTPSNLSPRLVLRELTHLRATKFSLLGQSQSTFTHHRITTRLYRADDISPARTRRSRHVAHSWVRPAELQALAASKAQRRLFALL